MVQTASYDPIVVEPQLTDQKVDELLERGMESAKLDYKESFDPSSTEHKVKMAKHAIAMANTVGGYIVIGIQNDGVKCGIDEKEAESIDESTIRAQINSYTDARIPIFVNNAITRQGKRYAIITVLPLNSELAVISSQGNIGGKSLFTPGDVLVRHGSASKKWNHHDAKFILSRIARAQKDEWLREFGSDLRRLIHLELGRSGPEIDEGVFELSSADFRKLIIDLLRSGNG